MIKYINTTTIAYFLGFVNRAIYVFLQPLDKIVKTCYSNMYFDNTNKRNRGGKMTKLTIINGGVDNILKNKKDVKLQASLQLRHFTLKNSYLRLFFDFPYTVFSIREIRNFFNDVSKIALHQHGGIILSSTKITERQVFHSGNPKKPGAWVWLKLTAVSDDKKLVGFVSEKILPKCVFYF